MSRCFRHSMVFRIHWLILFFPLMAGCGGGPSREQLVADSTSAAGMAALAEGRELEAKALLRSALALDERLGRTDRTAEETGVLAHLAAVTGDIDSALLYYERSIRQYRETAQRDSVRSLTLAMVQLVLRTGQSRKAFRQLEDALRLARVFGDSVAVQEYSFALLPVCRTLERWDMEERMVNNLLKGYSNPPQPGKLARLYAEIGRSQFFRGEFDRAAEHFLRGFTYAEQARDSVLAIRCLLHVAMSFDAMGRVTETFQSFSDGLKRAGATTGAHEVRTELLLRIGNAYLRAGMVDQARRFFQAALAAAIGGSNKILEGYCIIQLGACDLTAQPDEAVTQCRSAILLCEAFGFGRGLSYAHIVLGRALERKGESTEALQAFRNAVGHLERLRSPLDREELLKDCEETVLGGRISAAYDDAIGILLRTGQPDDAFILTERRNAWIALSKLGGLELAIADPSGAAALSDFRLAEGERIGVESRLAEFLVATPQKRDLLQVLKQALERTEERVRRTSEVLVRLHPALEPFVQIRGPAPNEIQNRLAPGTTLLEYFPTRRSLAVFVLQNGRRSVQVAAVDRGGLVSAIRSLETAMRRAEAKTDSISRISVLPDDASSDLLRYLYEAFVRPVEADIALSSRVIVVLPEELSLVPLHALRRNRLPGTLYLGQQRSVSYLPAASWVRAERPEAVPIREVIGLGYRGSTGWDVEYELRDIRAFYRDARLYFGTSATEGTLEREHADLLHLALVFRYNPAAPGNTAAVFSDGRSADLTARVSLGRFASLGGYRAVVVSDLWPGKEGSSSVIAPSLLSGGATAVVVTAYTPSRKAKKVFSESFYTALLGGADVQTALRSVYNEMIGDPEFASPLVWGTYALWGD